MRVIGRLRTGFTMALAWVSPRLLALVETRYNSVRTERLSDVLLVDRRGRVLRRSPLPAGLIVAAIEPSRAAVALLLIPEGSIGPPLLASITSGGLRSVSLAEISAGDVPADPTSPQPTATTLRPGLAVDPNGRAFVVPPRGPVAEVELKSLAVTYHSPITHRPRRPRPRTR